MDFVRFFFSFLFFFFFFFFSFLFFFLLRIMRNKNIDLVYEQLPMFVMEKGVNDTMKRNFELNFFESKCPDKTGNSEFLAWTSWNRSSGALFDSIKILIKLKHRLSRIWSHWIIEPRTGMVMLARMRMEWDYRSKLRILSYSFGAKW